MDHLNHLIEQAKSGNMLAFQSIVETHSRKTFAVVFRILNDKGHAEDCVQEVFVKLHKHLGSFDQRSKFSTWLYSVSINCAIDMQRKLAKHSKNQQEPLQQIVDDPQHEPARVYQSQSLMQLTHKALNQLSEEVRVAFTLRHFEDRTIDEISEILQVNPNTVKNRIFRGVIRLRELISPHMEEHAVAKSSSPIKPKLAETKRQYDQGKDL